jgi:hypothetical protein
MLPALKGLDTCTKKKEERQQFWLGAESTIASFEHFWLL